jgi:pimeloyl-ACP methyl ester carboxylesterase
MVSPSSNLDGSSSSAASTSSTTRRVTNASLSSRVSVAESSWSTNSALASSSESDTVLNDGKRELWFTEVNPFSPETIVMIHVLFSSHLEWSHSLPKLHEYHLLVPDLPHHSRSRHIKPFSVALAADLIADMIRKHAHSGRAHLVGISTGGFIALELVRRYPELVRTAFVSGCSPLNAVWRGMAAHPKVLYVALWGMFRVPSNVMLKASGWSPELQNDELIKEIRRNATSNLNSAGIKDTANFRQDSVVEIGKKGIRIAVIAAAKNDDVKGVREMGQTLRALNTGDGLECCAFVVEDAVHSWNLQVSTDGPLSLSLYLFELEWFIHYDLDSPFCRHCSLICS